MRHTPCPQKNPFRLCIIPPVIMMNNKPLAVIVLILCALFASQTHAARVTTLPFMPTTITADGKFAPDTHWYSINVRDGKYLYVNLDNVATEGTSRVYCNYSGTPTGSDTAYLWAFTGNSDDGYRMYNYALGATFHLAASSLNDYDYPSMTTSEDELYHTFLFTGSDDTGFHMYESTTGTHLNDLGRYGIMGFWTSSSAATSGGGNMIFAEVEPDVDQSAQPNYEAYEALHQTIDDAEEAFSLLPCFNEVCPEEADNLRAAIDEAGMKIYNYEQGDYDSLTADDVEALADAISAYESARDNLPNLYVYLDLTSCIDEAYSVLRQNEAFCATHPGPADELESAIQQAENAAERYRTGDHSDSIIDDYDALKYALQRFYDSLCVLAEAIAITEPELYFERGADLLGTYYQLYVDFDPLDVTSRELLWASSDESVATVDQSGGVTILGYGSCTITATTTDGSGLEACCNIFVAVPQPHAELEALIAEAQRTYDANSTYEQLPLIHNASQLYSNASHNDFSSSHDGGGLEALIDGSTSTFWHSYWSGGSVPSGSHYLRAEAPDDLTAFATGTYTVSITHRQNGSDHPTQFAVYGANSLNDDNDWTPVATLDFNYQGPGTTSTATLFLPADYRYLRFNCTATRMSRGYFHLAEFQIFSGSTLLPGCLNALYPDVAQPFAEAIATAQAALRAYYDHTGILTQADLDALQQALDTYNRNLPVPVSSVELSSSRIECFEVGTSYALNATVKPYNASNRELYWESSDESVATVDQSGYVITCGKGSCVVTAYATDGSGLSASCLVNVYGHADLADLLINEIQVANIDQHFDPSHNYSGWIELYNPDDAPINLAGLYVGGNDKDGNEKPLFRLCEDFGEIPAHGFRNIWFDHYAVYDNKVDDARKQVYWKLDCDGGNVRLLAADAITVICSMDYPAMLPRTSYARTTDGGDDWAWHTTGTPEGSNDGQPYLDTPQRIDPPAISEDSRIFQGSLDVSVDIPEGATLRYTTDGSTPTESSPVSYDGYFYVSNTRTYRFRLFADGFLPSPVVTRSWICSSPSSLNRLPVISITTADANLNSSDRGIFASSSYGRTGQGAGSPTNRNMDWERPVNFEYFDLTPDGDYRCVVNQETDMAVCGGWSRNGGGIPPFKIKASEQYDGQNYLLYPFFRNKAYNKNRVLQMRSEGSLADAGAQEIALRSGLHIDAQAWQPAMLYINGVSRGYRPIREPNNKHYALANYGINTDFVDVFEIHCDSNYVQSSGTPEAFDRWYDLAKRCGTDEAAYDEIFSLLDVEEYMNYMAIELYCGNNDWPWNNFKGFRASDGRFHMMLMDIGDRLCTISTSFDNLRTYTTRHYRSWLGSETKVASIFYNMMRHPDLRRRFIDAFCLVAYSVYDPDYVREVGEQLAAESNGYLSYSPLTSNLTASRQQTMLSQLIKCPEMQLDADSQFAVDLYADIPEARLHLNGLPIPRQRFNGTMFAPATLTAEAPEGYTFAGWQDAYGNVLSADAEWTITEGYGNAYGTVVATFVRSDEYAQLPPVRVNEVSAANGIFANEHWSRKDWIELYNTTDADFDVAGMYLSDDPAQPHKWLIPEDASASTLIPAHGTLIVWADKEPGSQQLHAPFKLSNADGCSVTITAADDAWADRLTYKAHGERESYGRYPDGARRDYRFDIPTIDSPNSLACFLRSDEPDEPAEPQPATIQLELAAGWNWLSHPFAEAQPASIFTTDGALRIRGQKDELILDDTYGWVGTLTDLTPARGYKAEYSTPAAVSLTGMLYDTATTPVSLPAGWNWVGCPLANATATGTALAGLNATEGDAIVGLDGFCTYTGGEWTGSLATLSPGQGYLLHTAAAQRFCWNALSSLPANRRLMRETADDDAPWPVDLHAYPNVMSLIATIDGYATDLDGLTLAAFATADANGHLGECRGVSTIVDGRFYLNIHGDNAERLNFVVLDACGQTFNVTETLNFVPQSLVGTHAAPYAFSLCSTPTSVELAHATDAVETAFYTPAGQRIVRLQPGVNIVATRYANGRTLISKVTIGD